MQLIITPTEQMTEVDGAQVRVWEGRSTRTGARCLVYVRRIAVHEGERRQSEFERELLEISPPREVSAVQTLIDHAEKRHG